MFILNLTGPTSDRSGPRLDPTAPPLSNQTRRENNSNTSSGEDSIGEHEEVSRLGIQPADLRLPAIFRTAIGLFRDSPEQQKFISDLFFASNEVRLAYIAERYSPEVANALRAIGDLEDSKKQQEIQAVSIVGSIDPNPNGPLGALLGMLGGLKFPESIAIALGKIASLNDMAKYLLQIAAREGKKEQALGYADAVKQTPVSLPGVDTDDVVLASDDLNYASDVVRTAGETADRVVKKKNREQNAQHELIVLNEQIPNVQNRGLREQLKDRLDGLKDLATG